MKSNLSQSSRQRHTHTRREDKYHISLLDLDSAAAVQWSVIRFDYWIIGLTVSLLIAVVIMLYHIKLIFVWNKGRQAEGGTDIDYVPYRDSYRRTSKRESQTCHCLILCVHWETICHYSTNAMYTHTHTHMFASFIRKITFFWGNAYLELDKPWIL